MRGKLFLEPGQFGQREIQRAQITRVACARAQPRNQPLEILHLQQPVAQVAQQTAILAQRLNGIVPVVNLVELHQRPHHPVAQQAAAHRGLRRVEHAEQRGRAAGS